MNVFFCRLFTVATGEHYSIYCWQVVLFEAEAFAYQAFDLIASRREADILFGDNQPQAGMPQAVGSGEYQKGGVGNFYLGGIKDRRVIAGV